MRKLLIILSILFTSLCLHATGNLSYKVPDIITSHQVRAEDDEVVQIVSIVYKTAHSYKVDPLIILGIIYEESRYDSDVAGGLMQITWGTAKECAQDLGINITNRKSLTNPELNIRLGTYYLSKLQGQFKDPYMAVGAYNMGPGGVRTQRAKEYSRRVKRFSDRISRQI